MYDCDYFYIASSTEIASSTCSLSTTSPSTIATTSDIIIVPTMTAGEVLIAWFLFLIVMLMLAQFVFKALDRVRIKRKVIGYSNGDVEVREDV